MSRMIKIESSFLEKVKQEFLAMLDKGNFKDNTISFSQKIVGNTNKKADLFIEDIAYSKMFALVDNFNTEIAWHGLARRDDEGKYTITDVVVYPQVVTGATVNTDQEKYQMWLYELPDEVFPQVRAQCHSHVNMSTSPSGTDTNYYDQIVEQLGDEDFYIFMILNKRRDIFVNIYDKKYNVMYESKDVTVSKRYDDEIDNLLKDAKEKCKERVFEVPAKKYQSGVYNYGWSWDAKRGSYIRDEDDKLDKEIRALEEKYNKKADKKKEKESPKIIKVKGNMDDTIRFGRTGYNLDGSYADSYSSIYGLTEEEYNTLVNDPYGFM